MRLPSPPILENPCFSPSNSLCCCLCLSPAHHPTSPCSSLGLPHSSREGMALVTHQDHCNPALAHTSSKDPAAQAGAGAITGRAQHLGAREQTSLWTSQPRCPAQALGSGLPPLLLWGCRQSGEDWIKGHSSDSRLVVIGDWKGREGKRGRQQNPADKLHHPPTDYSSYPSP